ncbi:DUF2752 domain-containing protein [Streptomyces xiaopingdaonensis]|uniref:DUF2752 domain-containing protein n=1 Tax=Streptomyces xiaopingdaonensis TaxID=1565415 RepID=UPI0002E88912|nr:DUF2752 domain-containing protein [Streptomyces xiaopingdaonensis]
MPRLAAPLAALAAAGAAFAYVGAVDPNTPGHYPACPLLTFTGVYCPGCGGLRAAHALAHGDVPAALGANAFAVVLVVLLAGVLLAWLVRSARGRPLRVPAPSAVHWWAVGAVVGVFSVVRNLPFGAVLAP